MRFAGEIEIDGQRYRYTLAPVDGSGVAKPMVPMAGGGMAAAGSPAAAEQVFEVLLLSHSMKSDIGKNGKPYERHAFKGSDNRNYITFRNNVVADLQPLVGTQKPVRIVGNQTKFGVDIVRVE